MPKVPAAHLEARKQSIVDAAYRVFCSKGIQQATMADVAAEAGISAGAIYRYFPSKDQLAHFCLDEAHEAILSQWKTGPTGHLDDPMGSFRALAEITFGILDDPKERTDSILMLERVLSATRYGDSEALAEVRAEQDLVIQGVQQYLVLAQEAGQIDRGIDAAELAVALVGFYWGARVLKLMIPGANMVSSLLELTRLFATPATTPKT